MKYGTHHSTKNSLSFFSWYSLVTSNFLRQLFMRSYNTTDFWQQTKKLHSFLSKFYFFNIRLNFNDLGYRHLFLRGLSFLLVSLIILTKNTNKCKALVTFKMHDVFWSHVHEKLLTIVAQFSREIANACGHHDVSVWDPFGNEAVERVGFYMRIKYFCKFNLPVWRVYYGHVEPFLVSVFIHFA